MTDWVILGLVLALLGAAFLLLSAWDKAKWAEMRAEEQTQVAAHYRDELVDANRSLSAARSAPQERPSGRQYVSRDSVLDYLGCGPGGGTGEFLRNAGTTAASLGGGELAVVSWLLSFLCDAFS